MLADAAGVPGPVRECCVADGQEHDDAQGHSGQLENNLSLEKLLSYIRGFVFTKQITDTLQGDMAVALPVLVPLHCVKSLCRFRKNIGLEPEKTSLFQALGIISKIFRGTIEILNDVHLIKPGDKVGRRQ